MAAIDEIRPAQGLAALTAAALALPGMLASAEEAPAWEFQTSRYEESGGRMRAVVYQSALDLPVNERLNLRVNGVKDIISGASPMAVSRGRNGKLGLLLSGASIRDVRDAVDIAASYTLDTVKLGLDAGRSSENDYNSNFFNLDARWDLNRKNTTLAAGYGFASDEVWAVRHEGSDTIKRPNVGGDKANHQGLLGITQVLDKQSLAQLNLSYSDSAGYLSDPYKYVVVDSRYLRDSRPGQRRQFSVLARYARQFPELEGAALHLDYRYYSDNWNIGAHTFEAAWHQPMPGDWQLVPNVRYYSQNAADFYNPVFDAARSDGHYSSDYRLAGFGSISGGVKLEKTWFESLRLSGGVEFYQRRKDWGFNGGAGTAADNFSFSLFTLGVQWKF